MNCMKYRKRREKEVDKQVHPAIQRRINQFLFEATNIGVDTAVHHLKADTQKLKEKNKGEN